MLLQYNDLQVPIKIQLSNIKRICGVTTTFRFLSSTLFPPYLLLSSSSSKSYSTSSFVAEVFLSVRFNTKYTITTTKHNEKNNRLYGMRLRASSAIGNNQNIILFFMKFAVVVIVLLRFRSTNWSSFVPLVLQDYSSKSSLQKVSLDGYGAKQISATPSNISSQATSSRLALGYRNRRNETKTQEKRKFKILKKFQIRNFEFDFVQLTKKERKCDDIRRIRICFFVFEQRLKTTFNPIGQHSTTSTLKKVTLTVTAAESGVGRLTDIYGIATFCFLYADRVKSAERFDFPANSWPFTAPLSFPT
jgi:hypothetical protein